MRVILYFIFFALAFASCKNAQKLLDKGNYEKAFYTALSDYKKNTSNDNAKSIVAEAYNNLVAQTDDYIAGTNKLKPIDKYPAQLKAFQKVQKLTDAVVSTPSLEILNAKDYSLQIDSTATLAAGAFYDRAEKYFAKGNKENYLKAYENFVQAEKFLPNYKDVADRVEEAYEAAVTKIFVNNIDQRFGVFDNLNSNNLNNQVMWELNNIGSRKLNKFYASWNFAQTEDMQPEQEMNLYFYGLNFYPFQSTSNNYSVSKNITDYVDGKPVSSTVYATVYVTRHTGNASVAMDCRIQSYTNNRIIYSNRYNKNYMVDRRTASYSGDSRALSNTDWQLINEKYVQPSRQDIYDELIKRLLEDFTMDMRRIYN